MPRATALLVAALAAAPVAWGDACAGHAQLHALLAASGPDGVSAQLLQCVAPLLLAPYKWSPGPSAADYCAQPPCQRAVAALAGLPPCTWAAAEAGGDAADADALRVARQVLQDCAR